MFNLEDFKKYGVAIRRDGRRARFIVHIPDAESKTHRLLSMTDDGVLWFASEDGMFSAFRRETNNDLIDVVRPMLNVRFSVPEPLRNEPEPGDTVYVLYGDIFAPNAVEVIWGGQDQKFQSMVMERGFVWETMEEAQAVADILKKGFRQ